jgi:pimeloyl-ACP methyl ester carboxylesterase
MNIRHFLERSGAPSLAAVPDGIDLLVVIDHREARVFKADLHGSMPQRITPYDPHGSRRHLRYVEDDTSGQRKPELKAFYDAVARTLEGAERILLLGSSTGASSAMEHLNAELKLHHPELARRVVGVVVVDAGHMTDDQLLARAREVYARGPAR